MGDDRANPKQKSGVWPGVKTCLRYHTGSLAFGSFIVALVQFIRYFLKYMEMQAKSQKNRVMVLVLKCLQCCLWCFEKSIKFLNKNAYIQIAIHGTNFCISAKNAFQLILANFVRFGVMAMLGSALQFLGWVFIATLTAVMGYFILQALHPDVSPVLPVMSYVGVGYLVGKLFMNVFALAVDTSLQCFITDEKNPGAAERVPGPLKSMLSDERAKPKDASSDPNVKVVPADQ